MDDLSKILSTIDVEKGKAICQKYKDLPKTGYLKVYDKYLNFEEYVGYALYWVKQADLNLVTNKTFLNLGCGAGYISAILKYFGNDVTSVDKDNHPFIQEMLEFFGIKKVTFNIQKNQDLPLGKFDYIIGTNVNFDRYWDASNWDFFLKSIIQNNLNKGGKLYFLLGGRYEDPECINVWKKLGIDIQRNRLRYTKC